MYASFSNTKTGYTGKKFLQERMQTVFTQIIEEVHPWVTWPHKLHFPIYSTQCTG